MTERSWTGRDAIALRKALRLSTELFAARLEVAPRTVAQWAERPESHPRATIQRNLDALLGRADPDTRARFAEQATPEGPVSPQFFRAALAVVTNRGRVLLVCRKDDNSGIRHGFPAGTIKPGDEPAAVAVRECLSETGVVCEVSRHVGGRVHPVTGVRCEYFACIYISGEPVNRDAAENDGVLWVPVADLALFVPRGSVFPPVLDILEKIHA